MNLWPQSNGNMSKISYIKLEMKKCQGNSELSILNVVWRFFLDALGEFGQTSK